MTNKIPHLDPQKTNMASLNLPSAEYVGASIEEELNYLLSRINELPPHAQASYSEQIRSCAQHALFELTEMQIWNQPPEAMKRYAQTAVRQLRENAMSIIEAHATQQQKKLGLGRKFREMDVKIQNCGNDMNFQGFVAEPKKTKPSNGDLLWAHKQMNVYENMALARMTGALMEGIGAGIQFACQEPPKVDPIPNVPNPVCLILKGAAVVFHELGELPGIRDVIKEAHSPNIALQQELYDQFGIPKEQAQHYSEDAFTKVAPLVLLPPATGAGVKGMVSLSRGISTASKTTQSFLKLRGNLTPPETQLPLMQKAFGDIFNEINRHPKINVLRAIRGLDEQFKKTIPLIELTEYSDELLWISAIKANPVETMFGITKRYQGLSHNVSKITYGKESFIVKEHFYLPEDTVSEFVGASFLNSLELRYLKVPKPLGIGKTPFKDFFVVKSFIRGETLEEMLRKAARSAKNPDKQALVLQDLSQANTHVGKAFGELHNKTLNTSSVISPFELANEYINKFAQHMTYLESGLQMVGKKLSLNKKPEYFRMFEEFKSNPGELAYGFSDINAESFTWSKADPSSIGFIDTEFVPKTFNSLKQPMVLANRELSEYQEMLQTRGERFGLSPNHISQLQNAFRTGYYSEFAGKRSLAAERFFDLNADVEVILFDLELYNDLDEVVNVKAFTASKKDVLDKLDLSIQKLEQKIANYYDK